MLLQLMKKICQHNSLGLNFKKSLGTIKEKFLIAHNPKLSCNDKTECYIYFRPTPHFLSLNYLHPSLLWYSMNECGGGLIQYNKL